MLNHNWIDTRHPFTAPHYPWHDVGWLRYPSNYSSNEYDDWCYRGKTNNKNKSTSMTHENVLTILSF